MKSKPVRVTLVFPSQDERDEILGQLSDGWGENFVNIEPADGKPFDESEELKIRCVGEGLKLLKHHRRMRKEYGF